MALATYADLIDGIRDWLARGNDSALLPTTRLGDLVVMAESEIYDNLRVSEMESSADLVVSGRTIALPADFIEMRHLYLDGTPLRMMEYRTPPQFFKETSGGVPGWPSVYTFEGSNVLFGPAPDQSYTGRLAYYARLPALSTALNSLFTSRPQLFLFGALKHAMSFIQNDERLPLWGAQFAAEIDRAQGASDRGTYGGSPLVMRTG